MTNRTETPGQNRLRVPRNVMKRQSHDLPLKFCQRFSEIQLEQEIANAVRFADDNIDRYRQWFFATVITGCNRTDRPIQAVRRYACVESGEFTACEFEKRD